MFAIASSNPCSSKSSTQSAEPAEVSPLACSSGADGGCPSSEFDVLWQGEGRGECMLNLTPSSWDVIGLWACVDGIGAEMKDVIKKPELDMPWS